MFVSKLAACHPHRSCLWAARLASRPAAGEAADQEFNEGKEGKLDENLKNKTKTIMKINYQARSEGML